MAVEGPPGFAETRPGGVDRRRARRRGVRRAVGASAVLGALGCLTAGPGLADLPTVSAERVLELLVDVGLAGMLRAVALRERLPLATAELLALPVDRAGGGQ